MEEKLNIIFEKLLEIESSLNEEKYQKKLKELEIEQTDLKYKIDDLKFAREKQCEYRTEMMTRFRSIDNLKKNVDVEV